MSNFWQERLAPAAPAQQPQQPASNRPWWSPAVPQQPAQQVPSVAPQVPQQQTQTAYSGQTSQSGEVSIGALLGQQNYTTTKAQSQKDSEPCPGCGGPDYVSSGNDQRIMKQCFTCGYNPRFSQSMSGVSGTGSNIPVKTARSQNTSVPGAPPIGTVIGHV